ncbi:Gfo/Idh/MocA family protein [Hyphomonas atlantica corrig.]|uniref:Gfo/Idh/MocA family protein n=1 Tax=Hyphomonas atlantica TaxID=1280948 RepID=UPI002354BB5C|nr:Gfo/Idh/MocA family oxidoreductase [Hyphomonas atlantica]
MKTSYNIALIGTGYIGKTHALAYQAVNSVFPDTPKLVKALVVDINEAAGRRFADQFGFQSFSTDWKDAINNPHIDIVSIATPNFLHKEMAIEALRAGKHVYCEKPLAVSIRDAEEMADAAITSKGLTLVGYNYLCNPILQHAAQLIQSGKIGKPLFFRGVNDEDYMADASVPHSWRCERKLAGPGTLGDLATHLISLSEFMVGEVASVSGHLYTAHSMRPDPNDKSSSKPVENDDVVSMVVEYANGAHGELSSSRIAWGRKNRLAFEIHGDKGSILFDQERLNEIELYCATDDAANQGFQKILAGPAHPAYSAFIQSTGHQLGFNDLKVIEVRNLLDGIAHGKPLYPSFADAIRVERVISSVLQSADTDKRVGV